MTHQLLVSLWGYIIISRLLQVTATSLESSLFDFSVLASILRAPVALSPLHRAVFHPDAATRFEEYTLLWRRTFTLFSKRNVEHALTELFAPPLSLCRCRWHDCAGEEDRCDLLGTSLDRSPIARQLSWGRGRRDRHPTPKSLRSSASFWDPLPLLMGAST
jgi:hypothetical protein